MDKKTKAVELFKQGYSCAQAVAGAFAPEMGVTEKQALALASGYGAGICATRQICGTLTGALAVVGLSKDLSDVDQKTYAYVEGKKLLDAFGEKFGTTTCFDLLTTAKAHFADSPMARTEEYYRTRPCAVYVAFVAEWLENYLKTEG